MSDAEIIAAVRAQCRKYRRAISKARRILLSHEHGQRSPTYPLEVLRVLGDALEKP